MPSRTLCPFCGASVSAEARYCDHCGTPLTSTTPPLTSRRQGRQPLRVAIWAFALAALLVFASGMLGGFRYRATRWPWVAGAPVAALAPQPTPPSQEPAPAPPDNPPSTAAYLKAVVSVQVGGNEGSRFGSGFLIDGEGHVITAAHVVGESNCVAVVDDDGRAHEATVAARDRTLDVAILDVPTLKHWPAYLGLGESRRLLPGAAVFLLGSPAGTNRSTLIAATFSRVIDRRIDDHPFKDLLEVSGATVVSGASGGPLVDAASGRVVGMIAAGSGDATRFAWAVQADLLANLVRLGVAQPSPGACPSGTIGHTVHAILATVTPLSGTSGVWGADLAFGAELALRDRETELKRAGYDVSLRKYDDEGNPTVAATHARTLDSDPEVVGVVGSLDGPASLAIANALKGSGLVMVAPVAGSEELTQAGWSHVNRLAGTTRRRDQAAARFIKDQMKLSRVYLVTDGSPEGLAQAAIFEAAARLLPLEIVSRSMASASADLADLVQKIGASKADVVYFAGMGDTAIKLVPGLRRAGAPFPVVGGEALGDPRFASLPQSQVQNVYFTQLTAQTSERFDRHFESVLGKPSVGDAAYGYDAARIILDALIQYGTIHPGQLPSRVELARLVRATRDYPGYGATVTFDGRGENSTAWIFLMDWFGGQKELRDSLR